MSDSPAPGAAVEVLDATTDPAPADLEAIGIQPSPNYTKAIELGHVYAQSGLVPSTRTAARAAVVIMIGMDLGLSPSASMLGIHVVEDKDGKVNFIIEGRVLGTLVNRAPDIDYRVEKTTDEEAELSFWRGAEEVGPRMVWTKEKAVRAGLWGKGAWTKYPAEMLRWRALAEGVRIYFPEVIGGQRVYVDGEIEAPGTYRAALDGPQAAPQLADEEAEGLRAEAREAYEELKAANPDRMGEGRYQQMLRSSGHSHAELRTTVARLREGAADERELQAAIAELVERDGEKDAKPIVDRAERRGSTREKVDVIREALADTVTEGGDDDGE